VSIESDANQDLALTDDDAEGVVGGKKHHKKPPHHTAATHAAGGSVTVNYSPAPGPAQEYTSDGDDCEDPGYAGSADSSS